MANLNPIELYLPALRTGLAWAQSWTKEHILCRLGHGQMTLMVGEANGFLAVWSYPMPAQDNTVFFLIPPFIARTLSGRPAWDIDRLEILTNHNVVGAMLYSAKQQFRLQWKWHPSTFQTPRYFKRMNTLPDITVRAPYVDLADIVHLAFANMMNPALMEDFPPDQPKGGILIDFMPGQINIDGESIQRSNQQARYYFNPKMLMRGLEIVRESHLSFTIEEIQRGRNAVLYVGCRREGWDIHCAVQSIGVNHQPATTPPMRIRETKRPMEGGSWLQGAPRNEDE